MKRLELSSATKSLAQYIRQLDDEPVAITDGDQVLAVLIATPNSDWESVSLSMNPKFLAIIERSRASGYREGWISHEDIMREFGITDADLDAAGTELLAGEEDGANGVVIPRE